MSAEPRRFALERDVDVSGVSGVGVVADGIIWPDGTVSVRWRGDRPSIVHWANLDDVKAIHGHGGATRFEWLDIANPVPGADYGSVWAELRGYVAGAVDDGGMIAPELLLHYLDELKRRALAPVGQWMTDIMSADSSGEAP